VNRAAAVALGWLLVLGLGVAGRAGADARSDFRAGYLAFERKNWQEVERRMSAAIAAQPKESARDLVRIGGTFSKAYLPWYYLGLARAELGRCAEAIDAFDRSESQREVTALREHETLVEVRRRCAESLPHEPAIEPAPAERLVGAVPEPPASGEQRPAVPPGLFEAATLYFAADYRGCLDELPRLESEPAALAAQAELFRAACEFALARGGDAASSERLARARVAAARYRALAPGAAPGSAYFSPEFLGFLLAR